MDRRKFFGTAGVAVAGTGVAAFTGDNRLFGKPQSLVDANAEIRIAPHLLKLHLEKSGVPESSLPSSLAFAQLATDIISNPVAAISFKNDPQGYLTDAGFPNVSIDTESYEFRVVEALAHPLVRNAARHGDTIGFLEALETLGLSPPNICGETRHPAPVEVSSSVACDSYVAIEAGLAVFALALVAITAFAIVDGPVLSGGTRTAAQIAAVTGGKVFASDVVKAMAYKEMDTIVSFIENGQMPADDKTRIITSLREKTALHFP